MRGVFVYTFPRSANMWSGAEAKEESTLPPASAAAAESTGWAAANPFSRLVRLLGGMPSKVGSAEEEILTNESPESNSARARAREKNGRANRPSPTVHLHIT